MDQWPGETRNYGSLAEALVLSDAGTMDVRSLASALIAAADAMREAHALLEIPGPAPHVEVRAIRPGSFIVDLLLAEGVDGLYRGLR